MYLPVDPLPHASPVWAEWRILCLDCEKCYKNIRNWAGEGGYWAVMNVLSIWFFQFQNLDPRSSVEDYNDFNKGEIACDW